MVLDHLLDLALNLGGDLALRDLLEERALGGSKVRAEFTLPTGDLVDRDGVELGDIRELERKDDMNIAGTYETVDAGIDDGNLDLHRQGLVLTLLCESVSDKIIR